MKHFGLDTKIEIYVEHRQVFDSQKFEFWVVETHFLENYFPISNN